MQSINSRLFLFIFSVIYGVLTAWYCQDFSRDYFNIQESIAFTLINYTPSNFLLLYHLKGNTLLLFIFDILRFDSSTSVFLLYAFAAALRFWFSFKFLRFWDAILLMFAFYWMLDWNQARFSLVFFSTYLISKKVHWLLPALHFMVGVKIILQKLSVRLSLLASIFLVFLINAYGSILVDFWGRYFLGSNDAFPLYVAPYLVFVIFFLVSNGKVMALKYGVMFISLSYTFGFFIIKGMSPVYLGRFVELFLLVSAYEFFLKKSRKGYGLYFGRLILIFIGLYQTITVGGNVWRFLS